VHINHYSSYYHEHKSFTSYHVIIPHFIKVHLFLQSSSLHISLKTKLHNHKHPTYFLYINYHSSSIITSTFYLRKTLLHSIPRSCWYYDQSSSQNLITHSISSKHGYITSIHQDNNKTSHKKHSGMSGNISERSERTKQNVLFCTSRHDEAPTRPTSSLFLGNRKRGSLLGNPPKTSPKFHFWSHSSQNHCINITQS